MHTFKKTSMTLFLIGIIIVLSACNDSDSKATEENTEATENNPAAQTENETSPDSEKEESTVIYSETDDSNNSVETVKYEDPLETYSSAEIEYARIWLQLGELKEVDELNVKHIPSGTPINPKDDSSLDYPEDVIQLSGSRLVTGSVTYSGNGDGTINIYNVPQRWDGQYPAGEDFYQELIDDTEEVYVDVGNDEEIIELIKVMNIK